MRVLCSGTGGDSFWSVPTRNIKAIMNVQTHWSMWQIMFLYGTRLVSLLLIMSLYSWCRGVMTWVWGSLSFPHFVSKVRKYNAVSGIIPMLWTKILDLKFFDGSWLELTVWKRFRGLLYANFPKQETCRCHNMQFASMMIQGENYLGKTNKFDWGKLYHYFL